MPLNNCHSVSKIDELSYHQNHHNVTCSIVVEELGTLQRYLSYFRMLSILIRRRELSDSPNSVAEANHGMRKLPPTPPISSSVSGCRSPVLRPDGQLSSEKILTTISNPVKEPLLGDYHLALRDLEQQSQEMIAP